jgi:predicted regulator of Ras-like GTPase activity (Roadblock/LC7/MglB family)
MLGFLKNLFRDSGGARTSSAPPSVAPPPLRPPAETAAQSHNPATQPSPGAPLSAPQKPSNQTAPLSHAEGTITLPLQSILPTLPPELQAKIRANTNSTGAITLPLSKVLSQLSSGAVKISFGELRQAAPEAFTHENDRDRVLVFLPLAYVLTQVNPALMGRRPGQKQVEVPAGISGAFDLRGQSLTISTTSTKGQTAVPVTAAPAAPEQPAMAPSIPIPMPGVARTVSTPQAPPKPAPSAAPPPTPVPRFAQPPGTPPPAPMPAPHSFSPSQPPANRNTLPLPSAQPPTHNRAAAMPPLGGVIPNRAVTPAIPAPSAAPKPTAQTSGEPAAGNRSSGSGTTHFLAAKPAPQTDFPNSPKLLLPLQMLSEAWPPAVRKLIAESNLAGARVALPVEFVDQGLKVGRIAVAWKTLRSWLEPANPLPASPQDSIVVDLPLKLVVPHFLARKNKAQEDRRKVAVDDNIPDLFFGFPQPETPPAHPESTAAQVASSRASAIQYTPQDTNYFAREEASESGASAAVQAPVAKSPGTKFITKYAAPNEIVGRAAALEGVAGALIALPDGLMVANQLPADVNSDTLAAFLPQIFGRVSQSTKELRMGELNNLNFTVGNTAWKIFRVNSIFFAAFGFAGQPLPSAQLAALAAELDRKPK